MQTVFDQRVDQRLVAASLAPAVFGSEWLAPNVVDRLGLGFDS